MISDEPDFVDREDEERRYRALSLAVQWQISTEDMSCRTSHIRVLADAESFARYLETGQIG